MPDLFARFARKDRDVIVIGDVARLSSGCFKKRRGESALSIICIDACDKQDKNAIFLLGEKFLKNIYAYGELHNDFISSLQYDEENNFCCCTQQTGKHLEHFEIQPDPRDISKIKMFETLEACEKIAKKLSEHSVAFKKE